MPATGLYHVGAREYDPRTARWLQRDPIDIASGDPNLYRYAGNDPINMADDGGKDWFKKTEDGIWIGPFLFNSEVVSEGLKTGLAAVGSVFTFGLWDGGAYKDQVGFDTSNFFAGVGRECLITAATLGVGEFIFSARAARQVQQAANNAQRIVGSGRGAAHGTRVHTEFAKQVQQISRGRIRAEVSYRNGVVVPRGSRGSVRVDAVRGRLDKPKEIWDLKTGGAQLTPKRIEQIRRHLPKGCENIPIREVRPR
ncbi:MAG: RHS repeat-associated core domain-containing protein [Firmicutes bacterium]|nr:RHS repeat-associated core domain-containing protein [Bacillota bacterium]MCL6475232.1 RHS repeat-associated core domain-containing protein [Bacillota bacterium]